MLCDHAQPADPPLFGSSRDSYYSMYNHVEQLAEAELEGARSVPGVQVDAYQIQETLSEEILGKMYAGGSLKPKYPIIKPSDLTQYDGILFGFPTRYGRTPAQVSAFFDATGGLWASGALVGKFVSRHRTSTRCSGPSLAAEC